MGFEVCARILLVVINLLFAIFGILFTAGGIILKWFPSLYQDNLDQFSAIIPDFSSNAGLTGVTQSSTDQVFDLGSILGNIGIGLLCFGVFVLLISAVGLIGACCKVKILLIVYAIILFLLAAAKIAVVIVYATGHFNDEIRNELNDTLVNDYGGIDDFGYTSLSWNFFMQRFQCCGLDGYEDFHYANAWNSTRTLTYNGQSTTQTLLTPIACCKTTGTFPSATIVDQNCTITPTDDNNNWNTGCWSEFESTVNQQKIYVYAGFGVVCLFEVVCAIFALLIVCREDKDTLV